MATIDRSAVLTLGFRAEHLPEQAAFALDYRAALAKVAAHLEAVAAGHQVGTISYLVDGGSGVAASGTVTLATSSGTVGATVNGVSVTVEYATSDTNTAALLAAAIVASANPLVNQHVTATSALGVVTITALSKGAGGNAITLAATGTGATASGARLTGGVTATANTVTV